MFDDLRAQLGADAPNQPFWAVPAPPTASAVPVQFSELSEEELVMRAQLAAAVLDDPLAVQRLSDRVVELLQQDLELQQDRDRRYRRRW